MKKIIISIGLLFCISAFGSDAVIVDKKVDCDAISKSGNKELIAQSGCCSWHGGVCGCSSGRAQCCDGALSPSCGCNSITPILEQKIGIKL